MKQHKRVLVVGLGRFGTTIVQTLFERGVDVVVVEQDERMIDAVKSIAQAAYVADGTDPRVLEGAGARDSTTAVVTLGEAFESSVLAVSALRSLGVPEIVARASTQRRAEVLRAVGATRVIQLEEEMGHRVAQELLMPSAGDLLDLAALYRVVPWIVSGALVGKDLKSSGLRQRYRLNVLGVRSVDDRAHRHPKAPAPDYVFRQGDTLLLVGEADHVQRFMDDASDR